MLTSGIPQMRQSEGNRTAKRLAATRRVKPDSAQIRSNLLRSNQLRSNRNLLVPEAIEGPATAALAWLARVLSPLLLKTASVWPAGNPC